MAAELIGTTVGVVGFLGQLFDGCVKAYGYFTTARHLDSDSQRLLCKVRIEEMRLVVWGREWGVAEGKLEAHLESSVSEGGNPQLRALARQILQELYGTVTDFKKLKETYGLADEAGAEGVPTGKGKGGKAAAKEDPARKSSPSLSNGLKGERSWRKEFSLRSKWVIADKEKFTTLLKDLKDFNDGLERLFPPSQLPSFQRAWTHRLLESAQRDLNQLSLLENASTGIYPHLTTSANLKKLRINLDTTPQSAFKPTYALKVHRDTLSIPDPSESKSRNGNGNGNSSSNELHRCQAHHESAGDVVIEWVEYDREAVDERVAHLRRMDDLARMMHSASERHPDLHSIDCLGYTDDSSNSRYGLVYRAPAPSHSSLHALIASPDLKTPDLNDRVRLAAKLAVATWSLHSLDWLHKSLCASNVLFFPSAFASSAQGATAAAALVPDIGSPRLSGFDASRPDLDTALSVVPRNPSIADLHRHPSSLRGLPYSKAFDIYSLGLVLLEIGLWKVLQTYYKAHYSAERWRDKVVLSVLVPGLGSKVGRKYREVVEMCLGVEEGLTSSEAGKLLEAVAGTQDGHGRRDGGWNRKRALQSVAVLDTRVYFHGGEISIYLSENTTISDDGEEQWSPYGATLVLETLSLPLDVSWDIASVEFHRVRDGMEPKKDFAFWVDRTDKRLYRWGGWSPLVNVADEEEMGLWVFTPDENIGGVWAKQDMSGQDTYENILSTGTGSSISCGRKGYYIGGYGSPGTDPKFAENSSVPTPGILTYDMSRRTWSNHSTAPLSSRLGITHGNIIDGVGACVDIFQTPVILSMAGRTADPEEAHAGIGLIAVDNITFWDPSRERWLWQKASGDVPQRSESPCAVGAASQNGTYEIFLYGGLPGGDRSHGDMHILSLPGFRWFKIDVESPARMDHACGYVGGGQMLSSGGGEGTRVNYSQSDEWPNALGVFDMVALNWKDKYEADLPPYDSPQVVKDWYNHGGLDSVEWTNEEIKSMFINDTLPGKGDGGGGDPGDGGGNTPKDEGSSPTNAGAIAGGTVGGIVGVGLIGFLIWFLLKHRRQHRLPTELPVQSSGSRYKDSPRVPVEMAANTHMRHEMATEGHERTELPA